MSFIPSVMNGVQIQFGDDVVNDVSHRVVDALRVCVSSQVAPGYLLSRVYISSVYDSHQLPSRHMQHKAVDISRINGQKIAIAYPSDAAVKAIVDAIQDAFENYEFRRENYGPHFKKKHGLSWSVGGHNDHVHLSVD